MRIFISILGLFFCALSCTTEKKETAKKPNVVFILVDDYGANDTSFSGSKFYETPNIDALANQSMVFTQGYAACRVCSPSRASIMNGQFTARHGITDWIGAKAGEEWRERKRYDKLLPAEYKRNLALEDVTLPEAMKEQGYATFFAGKWHLGDEGSYPEDHGFDVNKGGHHRGSPPGGYFSPFGNPKLKNKVDGENLSMRLANETVDFMKANLDKPFFAYLSFYAVHGPIQTSKDKWSKYQQKAKANGVAEKGYRQERVLPIREVQDNPIYAGLVDDMDAAVGRVLNSLKELGLDKNTIVVFTSDNGGVASGDAFSTSNLPLRGGKGYQWEGGIREPFFINVPWLQHKATKNNFPVMGTDFYPTILDLVGADLKPEAHIDGVSLKPILEGKTLEERPLYWHYPHYGNQGGEPSSIVRLGDWKLIHYYESDSNELYNLKEDESEQNNIAAARPEKTKELHANLMNWLKSVGANFPKKDELYDEKVAVKIRTAKNKRLIKSLEKQRMRFLEDDFDPKNNWWGSMVTKD
ncbi:sulfatase [Flavicella sediminum]|uniref:sulfatase n=1 Tax=Flavicella sediminum TaxID=2585141 RepID=UPI00111CE63A|nr:sulfatase [Flavicella sediminum]